MPAVFSSQSVTINHHVSGFILKPVERVNHHLLSCVFDLVYRESNPVDCTLLSMMILYFGDQTLIRIDRISIFCQIHRISTIMGMLSL